MFKTLRADWYFIIPATIIWLAALGITFWDFIALQGAPFHFGIVNAVGLVLSITGVAMRLRARIVLKRQFAYGLRILHKHKLMTQDIYRYIRHPAYAGDLLFWFGFSLLFGSLYGLLVMLLLVPCFVYRMRIEEKMLIKEFGDEYRKYTERTKRLIPLVY